MDDPTPVLLVRLELARAHLAVSVPDLTLAEVELSCIERTASGVMRSLRKAGLKNWRGENEDWERRGDEDGDGNGKGKGDGGRGTGDLSYRRGGLGVPSWLGEMGRVRVEALGELVDVERGLGREGRARRWGELIVQLEDDSNRDSGTGNDSKD